MATSKYTHYKYVKVDGTWRYCKAAYHDNSKIKPDIVFVNVKQALLEKHPEGRYYMSHNGQWLDAGTNALEAQRKRKQRLALDEFNRLSGKGSAKSAVVLPDNHGRLTLAAAAEKYFENCEARGLGPESIRKYRAAVDPFVQHCGVTARALVLNCGPMSGLDGDEVNTELFPHGRWKVNPLFNLGCGGPSSRCASHTPETLERWMGKNGWPSYVRLGRKIFFREAALKEFLDK